MAEGAGLENRYTGNGIEGSNPSLSVPTTLVPMGFLDDHLLPDERVVHRARLHWIIFGWPIACVLIGAGAGTLLYLKFPPERYWLAGAAMVAVGGLLTIGPALRYLSSDFAVTDKRVLAKAGVVRRQSLDTLLSKVEAIGIDQDMTGRLLGYGTVTITGTGGTREALPMIVDPLEFGGECKRRLWHSKSAVFGAAAVTPCPPARSANARIAPNPSWLRRRSVSTVAAT